MDSTIIAALISAGGAVVAALIAIRAHSNKTIIVDKPPPPPPPPPPQKPPKAGPQTPQKDAEKLWPYPVWTAQTNTPNTDARAKVRSIRHVEQVRVIEVKDASYRSATISGRFELEDQSTADPVTVTPAGKRKVEVICAWYGHKPANNYPQLDVTNGTYTIIDQYTGDVADNLA